MSLKCSRIIIKINYWNNQYLTYLLSDVRFLFLFIFWSNFLGSWLYQYTNCQHMTVPREGIAESQKTHERRKWEGPGVGRGGRRRESAYWKGLQRVQYFYVMSIFVYSSAYYVDLCVEIQKYENYSRTNKSSLSIAARMRRFNISNVVW